MKSDGFVSDELYVADDVDNIAIHYADQQAEADKSNRVIIEFDSKKLIRMGELRQDYHEDELQPQQYIYSGPFGKAIVWAQDLDDGDKVLHEERLNEEKEVFFFDLDSEDQNIINAHVDAEHDIQVFYDVMEEPEDIKFWLKTKTNLEGPPPNRDLIKQICRDGKINRPVILDLDANKAIDGRHRLAAAAICNIPVPVHMIQRRNNSEITEQRVNEELETHSNWHHVTDSAVIMHDVSPEFIEVEKLLDEELIKKGTPSYFQMGSSLPDKLYNLDKDGKATRDPGIMNTKKEASSGMPLKPSERDLEDAIMHFSEFFGSEDRRLYNMNIVDFDLNYLGKLAVEDLWEYDDLSSWMDDLDDEDDFIAFRGEEWARKAGTWGENIPPIVVVTSENPPYSVIGDGRGRVTYANYKNLPVPTWELKWKGTVIGKPLTKKEAYYHGTTAILEPGDSVLPPSKTGRQSEKGRKKNLDKVFVTKDLGSAKIYAGRAKQSLGGRPVVYLVEPEGDLETINPKPGTTVLSAPRARVLRRVF